MWHLPVPVDYNAHQPSKPVFKDDGRYEDYQSMKKNEVFKKEKKQSSSRIPRGKCLPTGMKNGKYSQGWG